VAQLGRQFQMGQRAANRIAKGDVMRAEDGRIVRIRKVMPAQKVGRNL
jgi:hypothetical protein